MRPAILLPAAFLFLSTRCKVTGLGREKAYFTTPMMTPGVSHRQNVCGRYLKFQNESGRDLRLALEGLQLHVWIGHYVGAYFNYDEEKGIHPRYPGLAAVILDGIAHRGKFTWRDTFGTYEDLPSSNMTWTDALYWGVDTYDIAIDYWEHSLQRKAGGVAQLKEWVDSSLILASREAVQEDIDNVNIWNWLKPYDANVWLMTIFTILISGVVYQILEWYADERNDRSMWEWWLENAYLSSLNFTQAYEYQPRTFSSRLFGVSMAIWALVMTATYTANLASLLVDKRPPPPGPETLEEISLIGNKICIWEGTSTHYYVLQQFPSAKIVPKRTLWDLYHGLLEGDCEFMIDNAASWNRQKSLKEYNPFCDIRRVGGDRVVKKLDAGFACKADSGFLCTGFIRDVINLHLMDMTEDGFLDRAWEVELKTTQDIDCDNFEPARIASINNTQKIQGLSRRHLFSSMRANSPADERNSHDPNGRSLKAGGRASNGGAAGGAVAIASASGGGSDDSRRLTPAQMIGTFAFHWALMGIALLVASANALYTKKYKHDAVSKQIDQPPKYTLPDKEEEETKQGNQDVSLELAAVKLDLRTILEELQSLKQQDHSVSTPELKSDLRTILEELQSLKQQNRTAFAPDQESQPHHNLQGGELTAASSSIFCGNF